MALRLALSPSFEALALQRPPVWSWLLQAQEALLKVPLCDFVVGDPEAVEKREEAGGRTVVLPLPGGPKCYAVGETAPDVHIRFCLAEEY